MASQNATITITAGVLDGRRHRGAGAVDLPSGSQGKGGRERGSRRRSAGGGVFKRSGRGQSFAGELRKGGGGEDGKKLDPVKLGTGVFMFPAWVVHGIL